VFAKAWKLLVILRVVTQSAAPLLNSTFCSPEIGASLELDNIIPIGQAHQNLK
jgi:hypothetical protein